jgi:hypothetical protein
MIKFIQRWRNSMAKRTLVGLMFLIFMVTGIGMAMGGHPDTGPGCGLGKLLWENHPNPQRIAPQVLMATTNGTGLNTIAISSGTSGCTNDGVIAQNEKINVFTALNFENISQDMAQGNGEHLASFATLMKIPREHQEVFFGMVQEQYSTLIHNGEISPKAFILAIYGAMDNHPVLAQATTSK